MPRKQREYMVSHVAGGQNVGTTDNTLALAGVLVPTDGAIVESWSYNGRVNATAAGAVTVYLRKRGTSTNIADPITIPDIAAHVDLPLTARGPGGGGAGAGVSLTQGALVEVFFDHTSGSPTGTPTCTILVNWLT